MSGPAESRMQVSTDQPELRMGTKRLIYVSVSVAAVILFVLVMGAGVQFVVGVLVGYGLALLLLSRYKLVLADGRLSYSLPLRRTKSLLLSEIEKVELRSEWAWHGLARLDYIDRLTLHPRASAGKRAVVIDYTVFDPRKVRRLLDVLEPGLGDRAGLP